MSNVETRMMPPQMLEARLLPKSFDDAQLTVDVVWSTGASVRRYDWLRDRYYNEVLSLDEGAVDMTRLNSGTAPVLDSHDSWSLDSQIGVVERAWIEGGAAHATIRLSARESLADVVGDIKAGIIRNISVGYSVQRIEITETPGEVPVYRVVAWQPHEISFVTVPADAGAHARSAPESSQGSPCEFVHAGAPASIAANNDEATMQKTEEIARPGDEMGANTRQADVQPAPASPADPVTGSDHAARAAEIVELAARHGMTGCVPEWLLAGHDIDIVRGLILDKLAAGDAAQPTFNRASAGADEADKRREAAENVLLARGHVIDVATGRAVRMDGANPMRGMTLIEIARDALERAGVSTRGLSKLDLVGRAFTQSSSDFPVLLEGAMHKALQSSYALAPDTWTRFCKQGSVSDFRAHNRYRVGSIGNLDPVREAGEFVNKSLPDGERASITAQTKGNIINLTRQAIINDDLDAFMGLATTLGRAAKRTIEADVYACLASNPVMADGIPLFHSDHGNLESSAPVTVASINAARIKLASQRDVGGNDFLALTPAIWLGSLTHGADARVVNSAEYDPDSTKLQRPNIVRGLFRDVVDTPRITDGKWYLLADPNEAPVIEVAFLDGQSEPFLDSEEGFGVDGTRWKVRLDFGIAAIDYRGAVRNGD